MLAFTLLALGTEAWERARAEEAPFGVAAELDRSPVDVALTPDEAWLFTANQTAGSVSLVHVARGEVVQEVAVGQRPAALTLSPDGRTLLVSCQYSGDVIVLEFDGQRLSLRGSVALGFEPMGIAASPDGASAYVALAAAGTVAVIDVASLEVSARIEVGHWPRYLALSPDGTRLAVGLNGDRAVAVVDTATREVLFRQDFGGINAGQMQVSADGQYVHFPWMIYRQNIMNERNIRLGWVLASRIARVRLDGPARRDAISLDVPGLAMSDPHGLALTPDEQWMVSSSSGTHELLVYRLPDLPWQNVGGPGDLIDPLLQQNRDRFYRVPLGGRPMQLRMARDNRRVFVANYLLNAIQVVDLEQRAIEQTISLGGPMEPSLARRGEAVFYDARHSLDQWYSCHSCHYEGGTNAVTMDTRNDGTERTFKTVLSLHNVTRTAPWTWHGWQQSLEASLRKSITETMLGPSPTDEDLQALVAYLESLTPPPNPYRNADGSLSEAALRGQAVFEGQKSGCANCHNGPCFSDGQIHDVGLGSDKDVYQGYNTPSLIGVHNRLRLLHHGRAQTLEELLTDLHSPAKVTGQEDLSPEELEDLIEFVKSL